MKKGKLSYEKVFAEVIGTFMLVFIRTGRGVLEMEQRSGTLGIALAFSLSIVAAAYSIGTVSGAREDSCFDCHVCKQTLVFKRT